MIEHEDFSVLVEQRDSTEALAMGDLSCRKKQRDRALEGLLRDGDGGQSRWKVGAAIAVERVS
jgi:hypothetical protein